MERKANPNRFFKKMLGELDKIGYSRAYNFQAVSGYEGIRPIDRLVYGHLISIFSLCDKQDNLYINENIEIYSEISIRKLAKDIGISLNTLKTSLKTLEGLNLIEKQPPKEYGKMYIISLKVPNFDTPNVQNCTLKKDDVSNFDTEGVSNFDTEGVSNFDTEGVSKTVLMIDRGIDNRIDRKALSKDKGVKDSLLSNAIQELFNPKKGLFSKKVKQADLAKLVKNINGNKEKRKKAEAKICLAKVSDNWETITGRDLCYWYAFNIYPAIVGKKMKGDVGRHAKIFADLIKAEDDDAELIFYSLKYIAKLYPLYNPKDTYRDPTLDNLSNCISWKKIQEMLDSALDNSEKFIRDGYKERKSSDRIRRDDYFDCSEIETF